MTDPETGFAVHEFVEATPGFDVLYYRRDGSYHMEPVVAWALAERDNFFQAIPLTCEPWALDDDRPVLSPDGSVRCGELEHWDSLAQWLAAMRHRERAEPITVSSASVLALDQFRHKFQPEGDAS
jgi:hypothetical protein